VRVAVLAPIHNSPHARVVCNRCLREPGVELAAVICRRILDAARIRSELRRDGIRLVRKVYRKLLLGDDPSDLRGERGFRDLAEEERLGGVHLPALARRSGVRFLKVRDHNDPAAVALLKDVRPDVVAFTGGGIIRRPVLEAAGLGVFNAHMGILPPYRGMDVVEWPILEAREGEASLGVTLHFMAEGIDTGPIALVRRVPVRAGDTMERLRRRYEPVMADIMLDGIRAVRDGTLELRPQAEHEGRQYFSLHPRLYAAARGRLVRLSVSGSQES